MVFVDQVVAVHHVLALVVAKTHQHAKDSTIRDIEYVLAPLLMGSNRHILAIGGLAQQAALLKMDMDGVIPAVIDAVQLPDLHGPHGTRARGALRLMN